VGASAAAAAAALLTCRRTRFWHDICPRSVLRSHPRQRWHKLPTLPQPRTWPNSHEGASASNRAQSSTASRDIDQFKVKICLVSAWAVSPSAEKRFHHLNVVAKWPLAQTLECEHAVPTHRLRYTTNRLYERIADSGPATQQVAHVQEPCRSRPSAAAVSLQTRVTPPSHMGMVVRPLLARLCVVGLKRCIFIKSSITLAIACVH
jgi:hypothetical protein